MVRRSTFIAVTILLFDYPNMQMVAHQFLTMATLAYLCHGDLFESQVRKWVEVFSEAMLLFSSMIL